MFFKPFELWGHRQCPHKTPSYCIPLSYPCHYTNLCPHKPHKPAHTHTHTHTHVCFCELWGLSRLLLLFILTKQYFLSPNPNRKPVCIFTFSDKHHLLFLIFFSPSKMSGFTIQNVAYRRKHTQHTHTNPAIIFYTGFWVVYLTQLLLNKYYISCLKWTQVGWKLRFIS